MRLNQTIKNIRRVSDVIKVFVKYGFEEIVTTTALRKFIPQKKKLSWSRSNKSVFEYSRWERIRMVIEELGPTFVKGAQMLSNRPDVLPSELIVEFEKLQDQVPPEDPRIIKKIVEHELEANIEDVFDYFDEKPLGSASIGQVHRGRLNNGEDVAIKIQRPRVLEMVHTDLSLIKDIVKLTEGYFKKYGVLNPLEIVEAFEKSIYKELDYTIEARSMDQFRNFYKNNSGFKVPKVYRALSTRKVLVQEFVSGCKITDTEQQREWGINPKRIAEKGLDIYLHQIFEKGYFHADPHPGNILIKPDGTIVLIDYGMIGKMTKRDKFAFSGIFIGMANKDARQMATSLKKLCINSDIPNMNALEYELEDLIEEYAYLDVEEMNMKDLTASLHRIIYDYKLTVPGSIFLILRTLVILEGIGKRIHPKFNTFEFVQPYGAKIMKEQYSIPNLTNDFLYSAQQFTSLIQSLPLTLKDILIKLRNGELKLQVENRSNEYLADKIDVASNRLVLVMLVCTFVVCGMVFTLIPTDFPVFFGLSIFSWISWSLSLIFGFFLFLQMLKNGK